MEKGQEIPKSRSSGQATTDEPGRFAIMETNIETMRIVRTPFLSKESYKW